MNKIIKTYNINNTIYEAEIMPCSLSSAIAEVYIYEVIRPNWKIFRRSYCTGYNFFIEDFNTIEEGVNATFEKFLDKIEKQNNTQKKWDNFLK